MAQSPSSRSPVRWKKFLSHGAFWLSAEVVLSLMGLDNLADYSEFLLQSRALNAMTETATQLINLIQ